MRNTRTDQFRSSDFDSFICSMNTSENQSAMYLGMDVYDYDFGCDEGRGADFLDNSMFKAVLFYSLFCLGLLGNATVLWILIQHIKLKTMTDVCLLNLVLSDLILAASLPLWVYRDAANLVSCKLMTGVYQLGFYSGTLFVTLMSVDRYLAIVHAVAAMRARTLRYGIIASVTIWVVSVIAGTPQVIFATLERDESNGNTSCEPFYPKENLQFWKFRRNLSENTVGLFVCLPIMIFCYVKILIVLSKTRNSKKAKAMKLIFTIVCFFVLCWVPYNVTVFLQTLDLLGILNTCKASQSIHSAMGFVEIIALSHCCLNPVIYAFVGEKFRKSLVKVLSRSLCWRKQRRAAVSSKDTTDRDTSNTPLKSDNRD